MPDNPINSAPPVPLHPEIWSAAQPAWEQGLFEHSIFDAFKKVESLIQARIGSSSIGDTLIDQAFSATAPPPRIDISTHPVDIARLVQVFQGSIGLFKGSRSHGSQSPSIPAADDPSFAIRLLAWASALVDLLDRDVQLAPAFLGRPQYHDNVLTIWAERISPTVKVLLDGRDADVVSRIGSFLEVALDNIRPGRHAIVLEGNGHRSRPEYFDIPSTPPSDNWHRVLAVSVPVFADEECRQPRAVRAILMESKEGGRHSRRVFPYASHAQPGDYVPWTWALKEHGVEESWVRIDNTTYYAWGASLFFSGNGTPPSHPARAVRLSARPSTVNLRPNALLPIRVLAEYTDGVGAWQEDVSGRVELTSTDKSIGFIEGNNVIRAKRPGRCLVQVDGLNMHTEISVIVAPHPRGKIVEHIGGIWNPQDLVFRDSELLVVDSTDTVWRAGERNRLTEFTRVSLPYLAAIGLDQIEVSPSGNLAMRDLSERRFLFMSASDHTRSITLELPDMRLTPMASTWNGESLLVADHAGGIWLFGNNNGIDDDVRAQFLWKAPSNPIRACIDGDYLLLLKGGDDPKIYRIDMRSGDVVGELLGTTGPKSPSAVVIAGSRLWVTDFHEGSLWARENDTWQKMGSGLRNPGALALGSDGSLYIAEFGADAIARMLP